MDAYIYRAALYCATCAEAIKQSKGWKPHYRADSETWPMGPYANGGGEADSPQHCDSCNAFLENPLTEAGVDYVKGLLAEHRGDAVRGALDQWQRFYSIVV